MKLFIWFVYGLFDVLTEQCYYVGGTRNPNKRRTKHLSGHSGVMENESLRYLIRKKQLYFRLLSQKEVSSDNEALIFEYDNWWQMIELGHPVQNRDPRNSWKMGSGEKHSQKSVERNRQSQLAFLQTPEGKERQRKRSVAGGNVQKVLSKTPEGEERQRKRSSAGGKVAKSIVWRQK